MKGIRSATATAILIATLGGATGCSNKDSEMRKRVEALETAKLTQIYDNYPPDSKAAQFIREELMRRGPQKPTDHQQIANRETQERQENQLAQNRITISDDTSDSSDDYQYTVSVTDSRAGEVKAAVRIWLRHNLNDPDSLEDLEWAEVFEYNCGSKRYCVVARYRARNSFNGYVRETRVFELDKTFNVTEAALVTGELEQMLRQMAH